MPDKTFELFAMVLYMAVMLGIGWWAYRRTHDLDDYLLAGRKLRPGVAALSAGASDMSGWLLLGLPGALYIGGLFQAWIAIGLTVGAWLNWKFVAPRLRAYTEISGNAITLPRFFENRLRDTSHTLRAVAGLVILIFFTFYVSAGIVAGGVFFQSAFGSEYHIGLLVVAGVTVLYTLFGGFVGATYTDVVQGTMIVAALVAVPIVGLTQTGGIESTIESIRAASTTVDMFSLFTGGTILAAISAAAWGLGYFGQPHILVRFMALRSPADATSGRRIGITWMILSVMGAMASALVGVAYFQQHPELALQNPERVFLELSQRLFHPLIAGFVLAAVLAAIMSTVSSQLIVSSSALVEDLYKIGAKKRPSTRSQVLLGRGGVLIVAIIATVLAWDPNSSILDLVAYAWAGFGAAFGPIVLLALFWRKLTKVGAIAGMIAGAVTVIVWGNVGLLSSTMYEIVPGFILNVLVAVIASRLSPNDDAKSDAEFAAASESARTGSVQLPAHTGF
ncbi:sodium/proline symporter [Plantibacter flavus]|uniref:Sodium/proline symporter n=1 Tax=Plantibacter flavus TaxID=150123 RepID=A0A3N2BXU5_9MICO|nr:sodium/proline symporter PutP [Plantibacter flavus]ROR80002.1 sodium/proline symporter [Plantibacter flavus]SMG28394.1 sodium/proline symporter [Plantibacter flavus]